MNKEKVYFSCFIPKDNIDSIGSKTLKVWNGRSHSYLALNQMKDIKVLDEEGIYFRCSEWFKNLHPWLQIKSY